MKGLDKIQIEAKKRHPLTKSRNYLAEGQQKGFIEGAKWGIDDFMEFLDKNKYLNGLCFKSNENIIDQYLQNQ